MNRTSTLVMSKHISTNRLEKILKTLGHIQGVKADHARGKTSPLVNRSQSQSLKNITSCPRERK